MCQKGIMRERGFEPRKALSHKISYEILPATFSNEKATS